MSVFVIAGAVVELPVGAALVQLKTVNDRDFDTAWTLNIIRGVIVAVLMLVAAWPVAEVFGDPRLIAVIGATVITGAFDLDISSVGVLPEGLPTPSVPWTKPFLAVSSQARLKATV